MFRNTSFSWRSMARFLATALVVWGLSSFSAVSGQDVDIGDIDMFGDAPQADPQDDSADDPLNLDDFGTPEGPLTAPDAGQPPQKTIEEVMQEGRALAEQGDLGGAIRSFNSVLNPQLGGNPNFAPASLELGRAYMQLEEFELATREFLNAAGTGAQFPKVVSEATIELGNVYMEQGLYPDAIDTFNMAVSRDPTNAEALLMRAKAQIRSASSLAAGPGAGEMVVAAVKSLDRAITLDEENPEPYLERAQANLLLQEFDKAVEDADKAAELDSETSNTVARRGIVHFARASNERNRYDADLDSAITDMQVAVEAYDQYLALEGDKELEDYEDADPELVRPNQILSSKADALIRIGIESGPGRGEPYYYQAIETANQLIEFDPDVAGAFYYRGVAQRLLGDLPAAIESWDTALEVQPLNTEFHLRRGIARYYQGENQLARRDFETAEAAFDGRALFWLGVTFAKEGDFHQAVKLYTQALRVAPQFKPAFNNRGLAFMQLGEYARAEKDFDELVRRDGADNVSRQRRDQARDSANAERNRVPDSLYYP